MIKIKYDGSIIRDKNYKIVWKPLSCSCLTLCSETYPPESIGKIYEICISFAVIWITITD
jgi:hypothetical protein